MAAGRASVDGSDNAVVWVDEVDPATAVAAAGSKMGRLTELHRAGVEVPPGSR